MHGGCETSLQEDPDLGDHIRREQHTLQLFAGVLGFQESLSCQ